MANAGTGQTRPRRVAKLQLVNLEEPGSFIFRFFPPHSRSDDRANWEPQDTTIGTQPLFYANRQPRRTAFDELWLDGDTGTSGPEAQVSISDEILALRSLMEETRRGTPPALLALWGDRQERVVMESLSIEEQMYSPAGNPVRAKVSLELLEVQQQEVVTVVVKEP